MRTRCMRWLFQCMPWPNFAAHMHTVLASDMEQISSHVDLLSEITTRYLATVAMSAETVVVRGVDSRVTTPMELIER